MIRRRSIAVATVAPFLLCSCGVYQAIHDDAKTDGFSYFALLSPVTAVTGIYPPHPGQNPLATEAPLIRGRNNGPMTQERADKIFKAIDKCWPLVKGEEQAEIEESLGKPDLKTIRYRRPAFVYWCQDQKYGERCLELTGL
jgi:hypothetical protein